MALQPSALRSAFGTGLSLFVGVLFWTLSALRTTTARLWQLLGRAWYRSKSLLWQFQTRARDLLDGPVKRGVTGPISDVVVGRRLDVSLLIVLLTPVLALATAWWVGSAVDFATLETWVRGTWNGTNPRLVVFLGAAGLLTLGTISAALNSGLVPTTLLVAGPVFGTAVTRYGTEVTYTWGASVVSLPNAVGMATVFALAIGVPVAVCSLLLGSALRRVLAVLVGGSGPASRAENA